MKVRLSFLLGGWSQLQELTDAVLYLVNYSYACAEQRASHIIAIAALRDVLTAFKAKEFPSRSELESTVADDLKALQGMQNDDVVLVFGSGESNRGPT